MAALLRRHLPMYQHVPAEFGRHAGAVGHPVVLAEPRGASCAATRRPLTLVRTHGVPKRTVPDQMNREQIRAMLGIEHPDGA